MTLSKITLIPTALGLAALIALSPLAASAKGGHERASFEQLDTNGDGALTQAEMAAHAESRFASADTDGDGFLSADELAEVAKERSGKRAEKRIARMIEHRDADGDGKLSAEEMKPSQDRITKRFDRADKNDDGQISAEEFEAASKKDRGGRKGGHKRGE